MLITIFGSGILGAGVGGIIYLAVGKERLDEIMKRLKR